MIQKVRRTTNEIVDDMVKTLNKFKEDIIKSREEREEKHICICGECDCKGHSKEDVDDIIIKKFNEED